MSRRPTHHVHAGRPGGGTWADDHTAVLADATAALDPSPHAARVVVGWVAQAECSTVDAVLGLIARAGEVGR